LRSLHLHWSPVNFPLFLQIIHNLNIIGYFLGLWCLTPLSKRRKPPTCRKSLTNFITQCCIECTSPWTRFELTLLLVIRWVVCNKIIHNLNVSGYYFFFFFFDLPFLFYPIRVIRSPPIRLKADEYYTTDGRWRHTNTIFTTTQFCSRLRKNRIKQYCKKKKIITTYI
jgi:hypothetical protein